MTCATCAGRIEGALRSIPGVTATVNFATERAAVDVAGETNREAIIEAIRRVGYGARVLDRESREKEEPVNRSLTARVFVSLALAVPILLISMFPDLQFPGYQWLELGLATPVVTWGAWPFHKAAVRNLRHRATTMDTLVSLGVITAYLWSVYAIFFTMAGMVGMKMQMDFFEFSPHALYFESAAVVTAFVLLGRLIEANSKRSAKRSLTALLDVAAKQALLLVDGREVSVPAGAIQVGDVFVVAPGGIVATDGVIIEGQSAVDLSAVSGESLPVPVSVGSSLIGGTVNAGGRLLVRATAIGANTELARLTRMVEEAQAKKAPVQKLVDQISAIFVPAVIAVALIGGVVWFLATNDLNHAIAIAAATLVVACPCALGLATPMALLVGTGTGARHGIIIRGTDVLESSRKVTTIVLDKTGTLTSGQPSVTQIAFEGLSENDVLMLAARIETGTDHPLARAIVSKAVEKGLEINPASNIVVEPGLGISGDIDGIAVALGGLDWLKTLGAKPGEAIATQISGFIKSGSSVVAIASDQKVVGAIAISDELKAAAPAAIAQLKALGITPIMASGDNAASAKRVAEQVGITDFHAGLNPAEKRNLIAELRNRGEVVAMVGDGINDAAALAEADLGIAMGQGTDVAIETSDIVVVSSDLRRVADAIRLSRSTLRTIRGNLTWAFGYNTIAIPIALAGLLGPAIAGMAMAFSSVFVVLTSASLVFFKPTR
jgi:Cu+-exporting ATPase